MTIPVYKNEEIAGLAEAVANQNVLAYDCQLVPSDIPIEEKTFAKLEHPDLATALRDEDRVDLFPLSAILVSVGWNKNDDVFDPGETFSARHSPVHKQFNFMHNEKDIIGHIANAIVLDENNKVIAEDSAIPEKFDIAVQSFLYRRWGDPELQERMDGIIAGIEKGDWFVSMECLFRNFDYAVITADGDHQIIPRTAESSYLTQHLRAYGGTGEFEGNKIGRLLRGQIFSGKGLVDNPANPRSVIFNDINPFQVASAKSFNINKENEHGENHIMSDNILQTELSDAKARISDLESQLKSAVETARAEETKRFEDQIAKLEAEKKDLLEAADKSKDEKKKKDEDYAKSQERVEALEKEVEDLKAEISKVEAEKVKANRISQLVQYVSAEEAEKVVDKWSGASDDQFADVVKLHAEMDNFKKKDKDDKKEDKEDKSKASVDTDDNEDKADADLDDAEKEDDATLASDGESGEDLLRSEASSWLGSIFTNSKEDK